jgi:hypothetical protein
MVPDRPEDIRPRFHKSKKIQNSQVDDVQQQQQQRVSVSGDDSDDEGDDNDQQTEWNLRELLYCHLLLLFGFN